MAFDDFSLSIDQRDSVAQLSLQGEFDLAAAEQFERQLKSLEAKKPKLIVIDLRKVRFIDSTGLQQILKADARSRQNGFRLTIVRGPANVHRVFEITGMDKHLSIVDDVPTPT